jgi:hypothetical protein
MVAVAACILAQLTQLLLRRQAVMSTCKVVPQMAHPLVHCTLSLALHRADVLDLCLLVLVSVKMAEAATLQLRQDVQAVPLLRVVFCSSLVEVAQLVEDCHCKVAVGYQDKGVVCPLQQEEVLTQVLVDA